MKKAVVILAGVLLAQNTLASKVVNKDVTFSEKTYGVCSTEMTFLLKMEK